jgi:aminoglycoside phosphotransferase (APT) family kinase protein
MLDQPSPIRPQEALATERLEAYLHQHLGVDGPLEVLQFPRGFSNLTYLLRLGLQELVLRRPPFGANIKSAHDMGREYRILSALKPHYPKVPQALLYCTDESVIGAPFYLMERLHGVILRNKPSPDLNPQRMQQLSQGAVDALVELHQFDYAGAGLSDLGKPAGYVGRQVVGWSERYQKARTDPIPGMEQAIPWLAKHMPGESGSALIHNDFKYDNLLLDPSLSQIIAVLDWEMATLGDPLMDLGTTLAYWSQADDPPGLKSFGLTSLPGNLSRAELVQAYARQTGADTSNILFYYVFGLFKVGVILQQIYARFKQGHTQDARFAGLIHLIRELGSKVEQALATGNL